MTPSRLRQLIREAENDRRLHVDAVLEVGFPIRSGSFVTVRRKCGKPTCHCAAGEGHLTTYLSLRDEGRTRMVYVPAHLRQRIAGEAEGYRRLRHHRAMLAKLAQQTLKLVDALQKEIESTEPFGDGEPKGPRGGRKRKAAKR